MATKHLCDRCNGVVETKEEFLICSLTASNAVRVERQRVTEGTRMELCANCAVAVNQFLRTPPAPAQPLKAGLASGVTALVECLVIGPPSGEPGRKLTRVEIHGHPSLNGTASGPDVVQVDVWEEKIHKLHDARLPEGVVEGKETKEGKEDDGRTEENPAG